LLNIENNIIKK